MGVVLLWAVRMRDMLYALFVGVPGLQFIPSVSCAVVRARDLTVSSHPAWLKEAKHDFIITYYLKLSRLNDLLLCA